LQKTPKKPSVINKKCRHRIRHYGLFASTNRAESIATARALLNVAPPAADPQEQPDVAPDAPRVSLAHARAAARA
jgi:hypothetical protein